MISKKLFLGGIILVFSAYFYNFAKPGGIEKESQYQTIDSFHEAEGVFATADKNTLVVFDADYTLIQPDHPACHYTNFQKMKPFLRDLPKDLALNIFPMFLVVRAPNILVDPKVPMMIKNLQGKGSRVMVLSAVLTGKFPDVGDILDWRLNSINKLGIELSSFDVKDRIKFKGFHSYLGNYPEFKKGVLLTNGKHLTKGQVLEKFLAKVKWQPKTIIFFDDEERNLKSMQEYAQKHGISFKGFVYKGAKKTKAESISQKDFKKELDVMKAKSFAFFEPEEKARAKAAIL